MTDVPGRDAREHGHARPVGTEHRNPFDGAAPSALLPADRVVHVRRSVERDEELVEADAREIGRQLREPRSVRRHGRPQPAPLRVLERRKQVGVDRRLRERPADGRIGPRRSDLIERLGQEVERHVPRLGAREVEREVRSRETGPHVAHTAVEVADVVHAEDEPRRRVPGAPGGRRACDSSRAPPECRSDHGAPVTQGSDDVGEDDVAVLERLDALRRSFSSS